ncbi:GSCFA domain-containing protein [Mangrovimonas cancribranchiae]|uniref:GSCFA domain-containing protein n=1 Tax=Mangrovimonas cancribranchiae TaxID=3080055 RepID=A0AAU6P476_9FLAO
MNFRTQIPIQKQQHNQVDYHSKVLLLGSCFVENIGDKLSYYKFQTLQNPFGILFHPLAIEALITDAINDKEFTEDDIFLHNELWHYFGAHSKLSSPSKEALLQKLSQQITATKEWLNSATHIVITLGTAWVYRYIETDIIVANCHKIPQKQFQKELLSVDAVIESLQAILVLLKEYNPKTQVIFTVSPVRHLKDGFVENTQSKAHLISAIHQVINKEQSHYFPSYEIMMDELRDYRFYVKDMLHPNETAIDYIWERFQNIWIADEALLTMKTITEIQKGLQHKPFNSKSEAHQVFLKKLELKKRAILEAFPHIIF